ncbi:MAG: hypothetical protein FJ392_07955 [Verrucomicrobia bacterium]|nr:hypothetical protein [Verrucomicrobiota bacterium]
MAKPALGKGLGELLQETSPNKPSVTSETSTCAPRMSAGMNTLVQRPTANPPSGQTECLPRVVRGALLAGDAALTVGAVLFLQARPADGINLALAVGAVLLGAWLGWLALVGGEA